MSKTAKKGKPARRPRRYLRSRITRNLILDTAQKVFISEGYAKTTIARISETANVGYGTVYSHFKGKDDILSRVVDNILDDFYTLLDIEFAPDSLKEAEKIFHNLMLTAFTLAEQNRPIMKVYQQALRLSETVAAHWQSIKDHFQKVARKSIVYSQEKGFAKPFDSQIGAKGYVLLVDCFIWEVVNEREPDVERLCVILNGMVLQGFFHQNAD
ncbi:MAG: TetR/AcrR family transcriptional regulator [Firmicutes bacterium]|nr:TetR/AcrR family transcriptional regulator [Bacillota bacterium]